MSIIRLMKQYLSQITFIRIGLLVCSLIFVPQYAMALEAVSKQELQLSFDYLEKKSQQQQQHLDKLDVQHQQSQQQFKQAASRYFWFNIVAMFALILLCIALFRLRPITKSLTNYQEHSPWRGNSEPMLSAESKKNDLLQDIEKLSQTFTFIQNYPIAPLEVELNENEKQRLKKLILSMKQVPEDGLTALLLSLRARYYFEEQQIYSAFYPSEQALHMSKTDHERFIAHYSLALLYHFAGQPILAKQHFQATVNFYQSLDQELKHVQNLTIYVDALIRYGELLQHENHLNHALELYRSAIDHAKNHKNTSPFDFHLISAMYNQAVAYTLQNNHQKALDFYDQLIKSNPNPSGVFEDIIAKSYLNKGVVLYQMKQDQQAIKWYQHFSEQFKDLKNATTAVQLSIAQYNAAQIWLAKNKFTTAIEILKNSLKAFERSEHLPLIIENAKKFVLLIQLLQKVGDQKQVELYLESISTRFGANPAPQVRQILQQLAEYRMSPSLR